MYDIYNEAYQAWIECGKNRAAAARKLGLPNTTFYDRLQKAKAAFIDDDAVICFWDVEISHKIGAFYDMYNTNINRKNILLDWFMPTAAWKIKGEKKIQAVSILDDMERFNKIDYDIRHLKVDDYHVIKTLHDMLSGVDILVHHNGDAFDLKMFNTKAVYYGLKPLMLRTVDTLKVARQKFKITSNSLEYLCEFFNLPKKIHNESGLALAVTLCNKEAIKKYVTYNKGDVECLEALYYKLLPYITNHPNMGLYGSDCCPNCGSHDISEDGINNTRVSSRKAFRCGSCGALFTDGKSIKKAKYR